MKFFSATVLIVASVLIASEAAVKKPDEVITRIDQLKEEVFGYQDSIVATIATYRQASGQDSSGYNKKTLDIIEDNIKEIASSDLSIRSTLEAETPTSCIANLLAFLDDVIELSGYAISNCIELDNTPNVNASSEFLTALEQVSHDASGLGEIIVRALTGRNVFTQGEEIIARVEELLNEKKSSLDAALADLSAKSNGIVELWEASFKTLQVCYAETSNSVKDGLSIIGSQLTICKKFGGRGARSAVPVLPNPKDLFPQLP